MSQVAFPFTITPMDPALNEELVKDQPNVFETFAEVGPKKYIFPLAYMKHAGHLYNIQARPDDIFVCTHPRSGTTLIQEMTWLLAYDLDYERAQRETILQRSVRLDLCIYATDDWRTKLSGQHLLDPAKKILLHNITVPSYESMKIFDSPRVVKTHLPLSLLPPSIMTARAKVIYVARNPKDVLVSYYYVNRSFGFIGDFSRFFDRFERNLLMYSPYWEHIKEGWEHRHEPNVLFLFYEEITRDKAAAIRKVAKFLDKTLTDDEVERLVDHLNIDNFRNNKSVNLNEFEDLVVRNEQPYVRNGKSTLNGFPNEYTPEQAKRLEALIEKNLKDSSLKFPGC